MRLKTHHVVAIQQPVQLLARQGDDLRVHLARPLEALPLQALLPQAEAVAFPVQDLDLVPTANATDTPFGNWMRQSLPAGIAAICTRWNRLDRVPGRTPLRTSIFFPAYIAEAEKPCSAACAATVFPEASQARTCSSQ